MALDPAVQALFAKLSERPALSAGTPEQARELVRAGRAALGSGPELFEIRELAIPTRGGSLAARLYRPQAAATALVVYLHGGGWVIGELDDYDTMARTLAARSGCALILPAYRLAPEHPFPAALEDAEDSLRWAAARVSELAGEGAILAVAGDSAGGNLATVAAALAAPRLPLAAQALIYPVTGGPTDSPSYRAYSDGMQLTRQDMEWFYRLYAPGALRLDPRVAPLLRPDVAGLPPSLIVTAEHDVLRDDGENYAARLRQTGVPVTLRREEGLPHGFLRLHNLFPRADRALTEIAADLARLCTPGRLLENAG